MANKRTWEQMECQVMELGKEGSEDWVIEGERKLSRYLDAKEWKKAAGVPDPPRRRIASHLVELKEWVTLEEMARIDCESALEQVQMNMEKFGSTNPFEDAENMDWDSIITTVAPGVPLYCGFELIPDSFLIEEGQQALLQSISSGLALETPATATNDSSVTSDIVTGIRSIDTVLDTSLIEFDQIMDIELHCSMWDFGAPSFLTASSRVSLPGAPLEGGLIFDTILWDAAFEVGSLEQTFEIRSKAVEIVEKLPLVAMTADYDGIFPALENLEQSIWEEGQAAHLDSQIARILVPFEENREKKRGGGGESWDIQVKENARIKRSCLEQMGPSAVARKTEENRIVKRNRVQKKLGKSR